MSGIYCWGSERKLPSCEQGCTFNKGTVTIITGVVLLALFALLMALEATGKLPSISYVSASTLHIMRLVGFSLGLSIGVILLSVGICRQIKGDAPFDS